jgi:hypothetical protein
MKPLIAWTLSSLLIGLSLAACDGGYNTRPYGEPYATQCHAYASCASCTPVTGCGWCFGADGHGACAADPDECRGPSFAWTWEPTGCRTPADAGISSNASDASEDVGATDATRE